MTFRTRLLLIFAITVSVSVGLVVWIVSSVTRDAFESADRRRTAALAAQFQREYSQRAEEVARKVAAIAASGVIQRIAMDQDYAPYYNIARDLAATNGLAFLELTTADGTIISSAQWPARFGYKDPLLTQAADWNSQPPFLSREELSNETALALMAVRGTNQILVAGGERLDQDFLSSLVTPEGMSVRLQQNGGDSVHGIPLKGRDGNVLAVLVIESSGSELLSLVRLIRWTGFSVGAAGILLALLITWWATARVTRPVQQLAAGARKVASGKWDTRVNVDSGDEIGELGRAFNRMTGQLVEQRERLVQVERVAAWRELARRLAHELKNPLFPLQITIENMQRAREHHPEEFDEVFRESTSTLLAELNNLKTIITRFSDFAKMPPPQFQAVDINELVRDAMRLFDGQLRARPVEPVINLDSSLQPIQADPDQLNRALRNLVLNALDAMPAGGRLILRTERRDGSVRLEISDTGTGLTPEERDRLFTPYYTTRQHGTGLGLAIVQSVVSDHGGTIAVESEKGRGTTFRIDLRS